MDQNAHLQGVSADDAALHAFERLSLSTDAPSSRPSSSHTSASSSTVPPRPSTATSTSTLRRLSSSSSKAPPSPRLPSSLPFRPCAQIPEPPTLTHLFHSELARHAEVEADTETLVVLHEACYGHRFSRPRATKAILGSIVERPERITAVLMGVAAAYVRLGGRYGQGTPRAEEEAVRPPFCVRRSERRVDLTSPAVVGVHGLPWMQELTDMCGKAGERLALDGRELVRNEGKPQFHEGDLYLCEESRAALEGAIGGVCDAVDAVFAQSSTKRAFVAVRPPGHHCSADFPSGFCWINNVHVGIQHAAAQHGLTHAVIFDFDLHHGDGSQEVAWGVNERGQTMPKSTPHNKRPAIGYYSLHDINSYPCENGDREKVQNASLCIDNAHGQSIWNVHLEPWSSEQDFMRLYEDKYSVLFAKARSFLHKQTERILASPKAGKPKAAVFVSAGFDASQWEGQGMQRHAVNVPTSFYERFTRDVVALAAEPGTSVDGRVVSVLEGGYSDRALTSGVLAHVSSLSQAAGLQPSDSKWWNSESLHALESATTPAEARKPRAGFASPTASFSSKVVDSEKFQRSVPISATLHAHTHVQEDVEWPAATHALCAALVPSSRSVTSCRPEDLAAPPRPRKPRVSDTPLEPVGGRQLRDRRTRAAAVGGADDTTPRQSVRANRRKTLDPPGTPDTPVNIPARRTVSRRSSAVGVAAPEGAVVPAVPSIPAVYAKTAPSTPRSPVKGSRIPAARRTSSGLKLEAAIKPDPLIKSEPGTARQGPMAVSSLLNAETKPTIQTTTNGTIGTAAPSAVARSDPDVGALTTAVKRITLKLGTREEHDRRQRERLLAERGTRVSPGAVSRPLVPGTNIPARSFVPAGGRAAAMQPATPADMATVQGQGLGQAQAMPPPVPIAATIAAQVADRTETVVQPTPVEVESQAQRPQMERPPSSPADGRPPVWSATGHIPFAPQGFS